MIEYKQVHSNPWLRLKAYTNQSTTSVAAERGFSRQNIIKNALGSGLTTEGCGRLMMIKIDGPELFKFDFPAAYNDWCERKDRKAFLPSVLKHITAQSALALSGWQVRFQWHCSELTVPGLAVMPIYVLNAL